MPTILRYGGLCLLSVWAAYGASTFLADSRPRPPLVYWYTGDGTCWDRGVITPEGFSPSCTPLPEFVDT